MNLTSNWASSASERTFSQLKDIRLGMMAKRAVPDEKDVATNLAYLGLDH